MDSSEIRVLVIDDDKMVSNILRDFLEDEEFMVDVAQSGSEALEKIRNSEFHAAVVDMTLDDMDGDVFIRKALEVKPSLICLIHTGAADYILPGDLSSKGLTEDHVFFKPIHDMTELSDRIRTLLDAR